MNEACQVSAYVTVHNPMWAIKFGIRSCLLGNSGFKREEIIFFCLMCIVGYEIYLFRMRRSRLHLLRHIILGEHFSNIKLNQKKKNNGVFLLTSNDCASSRGKTYVTSHCSAHTLCNSYQLLQTVNNESLNSQYSCAPEQFYVMYQVLQQRKAFSLSFSSLSRCALWNYLFVVWWYWRTISNFEKFWQAKNWPRCSEVFFHK